MGKGSLIKGSPFMCVLTLIFDLPARISTYNMNGVINRTKVKKLVPRYSSYHTQLQLPPMVPHAALARWPVSHVYLYTVVKCVCTCVKFNHIELIVMQLQCHEL